MKFDQLTEAYLNKRIYAPRNVPFSQEFIDAFKNEYNRIRKEVNAKPENVHKALLFLIHDFEKVLKNELNVKPSNEPKGFKKIEPKESHE